MSGTRIVHRWGAERPVSERQGWDGDLLDVQAKGSDCSRDRAGTSALALSEADTQGREGTKVQASQQM